MKRLLKIGIWCLGSLFALFLLLSAVVYVAVLRDDEQIKSIVVSELNKSLKGKVEIERMDFTFWSSFPYIALDFKNVRAMGANPNDEEPLLETERLSLNFNLRDMLAKKYEVKKIETQNGLVRIKLYADGSDNYTLWETGESSENFSFALKKIHFRNTHLTFINEPSEQHYELRFLRADAKGDFSSNLQDITLSGDFFIESIQSGQSIILAQKKLRLQSQIKIDNTAETVHILEGFTRLEDLDFDLQGSVNYSENAPFMNLIVKGNDLNLRKFIQQIPADFAQQIEDFQTRGDFDFVLNLSGNYSGGNLPKVTAKWDFRNGQIYEKSTEAYFENVKFAGVFSTSNINTLSNCRLQISNFSASLNKGNFTGNLTINNFRSPTILLNASFNADLKEVNEILNITQITQLSGLSKGRVQYRHTFENFDAIRFSEVLKGRLRAEISCKNVLCKLQDSVLKSPIRLDTARFEMNQEQLRIPILIGNFEESKFRASLFSGNFPNAIENPEQASVSGDIIIDKIQIDSLLPQDLRTSFHFENQILSLNNFSAKIWDGSIQGNAEINCSDTSRLPFRTMGSLSNINTEKLFSNFNNFEQSEITDKNLKGFIDANFEVLGVWLPSSGLDRKSLWATLKTKISDGELKNVEILKKLSRFVDEETLNHVKFATLENTIEIKHETVIFPEMKIRSNALNINVSGTQSFDGELDYSVKIALSELMSKRRRERRKNREESGALEDDKKRLSLFVHITGTTEHPKFKYDVQNVFKKLEVGSVAASQAIRKENEVVKNILKEEFQFLQKSEETKRQEELWRKQEQGKFVVEWEENKSDSIVNSAPQKKSPKKDTVRIGVIFEDE